MEIVGRILRAEHLAGTRIRRMLRREGLDRGGFDVLATLRRSGPPYRLSPTRLYEDLVLTSGAMTHRVDALERAGLVERIPDREDRRSTLVGLTRKGKALIDRAFDAHMECEQDLLSVLTPGDPSAAGRPTQKALARNRGTAWTAMTLWSSSAAAPAWGRPWRAGAWRMGLRGSAE